MEEMARGRTLDGRFELLERVTRGSLGEVWLAFDTELSERVVAKFFPRDASPESLDRLKQRVRSLRKLHHPNIVPVYELHRTSDAIFLTMPEVEGEPLASYRGRPLETILPLVSRIASALDDAHRRGAVHGGLQISKVLVDGAGEPRLLDFGLAPNRDPAGPEPSVTDDVRALGAIVYELVTGAPPLRPDAPMVAPKPVPPELEQITRAMLSSEASARPGTLGEVLASLDRIATRRRGDAPPERRIVVTPPPRVNPRAGDEAPVVRIRTERHRTGGVGWLTVGAFLTLLGIALAVFLVLPRWVDERAPDPVTRLGAPHPEPPPAPVTAAEDLEALAPAKTRAEQARARAVELADALDARGAAEWDGASLRRALDAIERGDGLLEQRSYKEATAAFESSRETLEKLEAGAAGLAEDAVKRGEASLASGLSAAARESFERALRIEPDHGDAKRGLRRAQTLDEVLGLVASGEERERAKDFEGAAELYRKAAALDPLSSAAASGLARVDARASEVAFREAMSEGMRALESKDFAAARAAFERAGAISPGASDVSRALAETTEGVRLETIARRRQAALAYESAEAWRKAEAEYRAVLDVDPTIRFAVDGAARTARYAELHEKIDFQISHSERLSEAAALEEASRLFEEASKTEPSGPALERKVAALGELVRTFATPIQVHFLSDNQTEVTVYRVGRLGKFDRRALELRPGTYTVVGSREGYRDVRRELVVRADEPPEPLLVRCEERI